jgi:hypothetical protein
MADANTPPEGSFVFDSTRLDSVVGAGTPLYLDFIVAPDRTVVAFRVRQGDADNEDWQGEYE